MPHGKLDWKHHMSNSRSVTGLVILFILFMASVARTFAAPMPAGLLGKWCAGQWISVTPTGFRGSADSEEYGCDLKNIQEMENFSANETWQAVFSCRGEFGRVEVNSLIALQTLNGFPVLVMANTLSPRASKKVSVPPVIAYVKCQ
jgi:hypothetical protein